VILYDVKTFPPTTAAFAEGFKKLFSGIFIVMGFMQP